METTKSEGFLGAGLVRAFSSDLSTSLNTTTLVYGAVIVGGLLVLSFALYMLDNWATSRIDNMLMTYYGPEIYDRYTSVYDPTELAAAYQSGGGSGGGGGGGYTDQLTDWTDDDVIRAYLVNQQEAQERIYHQQVAAQTQNMLPNYGYSYSQLQGYRSLGGAHFTDLLGAMSKLYSEWEDDASVPQKTQ